MFEITEWDSRYEVNSSGDVYKPGSRKQTLRSTPLDYVRSKVHGRSLGAGMRRLQLQEMAGDRHNEVFGLFQRFLEIAADASRGHRGRLLNSDSLDDPATAVDLAFLLNSPQEQIDNALIVLIKIGWLTENADNLPELPESPGTPGNSRKIPPLNNETETEPNRTELNESDAEKLTACELPEGGNGDKVVEVKDSDLIIKDDSDSDSEVTAVNSQSFLLRLMMLLPRWTDTDKTCFRNLAKVIGDMADAPRAFGEALVIARECRKNGGENPKKAFMYRVQKHFDIKLNAGWHSDAARRAKQIAEVKR